jgi:hypothetical protein
MEEVLNSRWDEFLGTRTYYGSIDGVKLEIEDFSVARSDRLLPFRVYLVDAPSMLGGYGFGTLDEAVEGLLSIVEVGKVYSRYSG